MLLGQENCDYSSMAKVYREYLTGQGVFTGRLAEGMPLYLDFTGYVTENASFLGVPYGAKTLLSTLEGIDQATDALYADGVTDIALRLKGYSYNGMQNSMVDRSGAVRRGQHRAAGGAAGKLRQNGASVSG